MTLGPLASQRDIDSFRAEAKLGRPMAFQYSSFLRRLAVLDLGQSLALRRPVTTVIRERAPVTVLLVASSTLLTFIVALVLPLGLRLFGFTRTRKALDGAATVVGMVPSYVLAVIAVVLVVRLLGWGSLLFDAAKIRTWIIPTLALAAYPTAVTLRLFDAQLDVVLASQYILRSRAQSATRAQLLLTEALPNAIPAAVGAFGNALATFVTGTVAIEAVFGIAGLGGLTYQALRDNDFPLLTGLCFLFAVCITFITLGIDLLLFAIDPRLRRHRG